MTAYYNENDPFAADWLRNLIADGLIAPGDVDDRSIVDVEPSDLEGYAQVHLFAGIGGWSYALRLAGWPDDRPVWTGSCPCQPLSSAGQRKGHADERHLWPAFYRLVAECRPSTVFGEQVASRLGREWLAGVRADLEHLGYAVGAADLPAAGVGAPHIRQRLWWVAHSEHAERRQVSVNRQDGRDGSHSGWPETHGQPGTRGQIRERVADAGAGRRDKRQRHLRPPGRQPDAGGRSPDGGLADADGWQSGNRGQPGGQHRQQPQDGGAGERLGDANTPGSQGRSKPTGQCADQRAPWSSGVLIQCSDGKVRRVEPTIFPLASGIPNRVGLLRGSGNAIVPQTAAVFIEAAMEALR